MTTTAKFREEALQAEKELKFKEAAILWGKAIDAYPFPVIGNGNAKLDINNMLSRAKACCIAGLEQEKGNL